MSLQGVRLSKEELAEIERKRLNRAAEADAYDNFTAAGQPYFFKGIELIENLIADNIMTGNLDIDTRIQARIKDQESALNNDNLLLMNKHMLMRVIMDSINSEDYTIKYLDEDYEEKGKTLDDVFGITIVVASDEERNIMDKLLTENFHVRNRKKMNKKEYKAVHMQVFQDDDPEYPLIECQIKTGEENRNCKEHTIYKVESAIERQLRQTKTLPNPEKKVKIELNQTGREKVYRTIQEYFNENLFTSASNIPKMWESRFNETDEVMERKMLSEGQTLKRMYPFLDMNGGRKGEPR